MKIEKVKYDYLVKEIDNLDGFTLNKKKEKIKITMYNEKEIQKTIDYNFNKKYRELLYIIMSLNEEDTTDTDTELVLLKINDLKNMLLKKYGPFLKPEILQKYLNMVGLLEEKMSLVSVKDKQKSR